MIVYNLTQPLDFGIVQRDITNLLEKFRSSGNAQIPLLYISLKTVAYDDTSMIPKLEYQGDCST